MNISSLNGLYRVLYAGRSGEGSGEFVVRNGMIFGNDAGNGKYFGRIWFGRSSGIVELELDASLFGTGWLVQDGIARARGFSIKLRFPLIVARFGQPQEVDTELGPITLKVIKCEEIAQSAA